ncbi:hypothetical protein M2104_003822 [Paenibacillus sp. PastH-2]|nr:hypothetical protein [Paenibacillus sp. PastH-2]
MPGLQKAEGSQLVAVMRRLFTAARRVPLVF